MSLLDIEGEGEWFGAGSGGTRVSSKQTKYIFGVNRKEPKLNLFSLFFV